MKKESTLKRFLRKILPAEKEASGDKKRLEAQMAKAAKVRDAMLLDHRIRDIPEESKDVRLLIKEQSPAGFPLILRRINEIFRIMNLIETALIAFHENAQLEFPKRIYLPKMLAKELGKFRISDLVYPEDFNKIKEIIVKWLVEARKEMDDFDKIVQEHGEKATHAAEDLCKIEIDYRKVFEGKNLEELLEKMLNYYHPRSK